MTSPTEGDDPTWAITPSGNEDPYRTNASTNYPSAPDHDYSDECWCEGCAQGER